MRPSDVDPSLQIGELGPAQRRKEVGEPVVVADARVLVVRRRVAGLGREPAGLVRPFRVVGDHRPSPAGGDDLVPVEGKGGHRPEAAGRLPLVGGAERLGGVGDQGHSMLGQKGHDRGVVGGLPVDVDRDANRVLA